MEAYLSEMGRYLPRGLLPPPRPPPAGFYFQICIFPKNHDLGRLKYPVGTHANLPKTSGEHRKEHTVFKQ